MLYMYGLNTENNTLKNVYISGLLYRKSSFRKHYYYGHKLCAYYEINFTLLNTEK